MYRESLSRLSRERVRVIARGLDATALHTQLYQAPITRLPLLDAWTRRYTHSSAKHPLPLIPLLDAWTRRSVMFK